MAKVPRNKGSYAPRGSGSSWQIKFPLGWSEEKKKYDEYREDVASEHEAIVLIKEINDSVYHGGKVSDVPIWRAKARGLSIDEEPTLSEFAAEFMELRRKQKKVQERTLESDGDCWNRLKPYFGDKKISKLTPRDIELAYVAMSGNGKDNLNGRAYSGTTIQKSHAFLRMMLNKAVDYELISSNPCHKVDSPKRDTEERRSLSVEQAQALFSFITRHELEPKAIGVLVALCCGLRLSEMLALKWNDYRNGSISVTKALNREKQTFKPTKNEDTRSVPCPDQLIEVLDSWKTLQQEHYKRLGLRWSSSVPIVNSRSAKHTLQRSYTKWYERKRLIYPIPSDFDFHELRHTYVTIMTRDCGTDAKTTRDMSGHKKDEAFHTYTHTNEAAKRKAANKLGALLAPSYENRKCRNCVSWTVSPTDETIGACWINPAQGLRITGMGETCRAGLFTSLAS